MQTTANRLFLVLICCVLASQPCRSAVTACVTEERIIVVNATPSIDTFGLRLTSAAGHLIPVPGDPPDSAPFPFLQPNTRNQVTWFSLSVAVTLDGDWVSPVGYDGDADPALDLSFEYISGGLQTGTVTGFCVDGMLKGDFNLDSVVDLLDIDLLGTEIAAGTNNVLFDLTSDDLVNQDDQNLFLSGEIITDGNRLNGDADFNGMVTFVDFLIFSSNFGQDGKKWSEGDFVPTGRVEFEDFLVLSANFGDTADLVSQIPEPDSWLLLVAGLSLLSRWQPRHLSDCRREL